LIHSSPGAPLMESVYLFCPCEAHEKKINKDHNTITLRMPKDTNGKGDL
jgi:hypothetical protein